MTESNLMESFRILIINWLKTRYLCLANWLLQLCSQSRKSRSWWTKESCSSAPKYIMVHSLLRPILPILATPVVWCTQLTTSTLMKVGCQYAATVQHLSMIFWQINMLGSTIRCHRGTAVRASHLTFVKIMPMMTAQVTTVTQEQATAEVPKSVTMIVYQHLKGALMTH